jgi:homoserine O-acetyltransferase
MRFLNPALQAATGIAVSVIAFSAMAADYPAPKQGDWVAKDFKFHTGEVLPELRMHYTTVGEPTGQPVVIQHGSSGAGSSMLTANFAGELFGPGQPLDATKYYIILPDAIGAGKSSKPSDGMRQKFPKYNYDDMVEAQYRLLTEGLRVRHVRLILGSSAGGMQVWVFGAKHPDYADILVPMASQPTPMASRNWMLRRMMIESIRQDPDFNDGNYTTQPRNLKLANTFFGIATNGGTRALQKQAPTRELADKIVDERLGARSSLDANDIIYAYDASRDYDPSPGLERIKSRLLAINSADDERNPPETGITEAAMKKVKNGSLYLIPASDQTRGHGTTGNVKFYIKQLQELLDTAPQIATQ